MQVVQTLPFSNGNSSHYRLINFKSQGNLTESTSSWLEVLEQDKFPENEERHYLEKDLLSNTGYTEKMLFQEEGKDGKVFKGKVTCYRKGLKTLNII